MFSKGQLYAGLFLTLSAKTVFDGGHAHSCHCDVYTAQRTGNINCPIHHVTGCLAKTPSSDDDNGWRSNAYRCTFG